MSSSEDGKYSRTHSCDTYCLQLHVFAPVPNLDFALVPLEALHLLASVKELHPCKKSGRNVFALLCILSSLLVHPEYPRVSVPCTAMLFCPGLGGMETNMAVEFERVHAWATF